MEFKPPTAAAAEGTKDAASAEAEEVTGREADETASTALAKRRRLEGMSHSLRLSFPLLSLNF